jgi:hypothetical protein
MKLGAENPKKVILTVGLMVIALVLFIYMVFGGSGSATASNTATQPVAAPAPATESHQAAHAAALKARENSSLDPTLRTDLLASFEGVSYSGTGRNIFKAEPDPPSLAQQEKDALCAQLGGPSHGKPYCSPFGPGKRPPPPPIDLKFFGFASKPGEPKKAFLSKGDDLFIASEGEIVDRRYKIVHINATSIEIEDVLNDNTQTIYLSQQQGQG